MIRSNTVPPEEQTIFDRLTEIRQELSLIKKDHSKFMSSKEITSIYTQVLELTEELKKIRTTEDDATKTAADEESNKVDILIDEIFQLLSLCFLTCGLSNSAPATYASLSTVQRLLEHLNESSIYTPHDLKPIKERLDEIATIIDQIDTSNTTERDLLNKKLSICLNEYKFMMDKTSDLSSDVKTLMDSLLDIKYNLFQLITENQHDDEQIASLSRHLAKSQMRAEHLFSNQPDLKGAGIIKGLIDNCSNYLNDLHLGVDRVDPNLSSIYSKLLSLKSILENLLLTKRWTLRTTDIFNYQKQLIEIDNSRVNGYFLDSSYKGQSVLLYLLRSCFAIIYKLLESSEPVSESLQPIHNQLSTIRRCLLDLKRMGGISSIRELYPYQLKLDSIDNMKVDGKFIIKGQIPEGQATVTALLAECFDIAHELKIDYYERDEQQESNDDTRKPTYSVIGTKASQDTNYDYNHNDDDHHGHGHHHGHNHDHGHPHPQPIDSEAESESERELEISAVPLRSGTHESETKDLGTLDYENPVEGASYATTLDD
jgi:regulator of replication initiation timing